LWTEQLFLQGKHSRWVLFFISCLTTWMVNVLSGQCMSPFICCIVFSWMVPCSWTTCLYCNSTEYYRESPGHILYSPESSCMSFSELHEYNLSGSFTCRVDMASICRSLSVARLQQYVCVSIQRRWRNCASDCRKAILLGGISHHPQRSKPVNGSHSS
jgi:hypothetical protein